MGSMGRGLVRCDESEMIVGKQYVVSSCGEGPSQCIAWLLRDLHHQPLCSCFLISLLR